MFLTPSQLTVILGLLLVLAELILGIQTGFDLVVIGSILIIGGFLGLITGSFTLTLLASSLLAIGYIFLGRKLIKQKLTVITRKTNIDKLIGAQGIVIRSITPDTAGLVRVNDEDWRAILPGHLSNAIIYEKDKVIVSAIEGVSLIVNKI